MTQFVADPALTLAEARDRYFAVNGFGPNGGYDAPWVDFKLGPIPMPFPNTPARVRAVKFHDLHHAVTGYATDTLGEFEISGWEIGSGCAGFAAAWALNLSGMLAGMFSAPGRTWRAFVRGRHSDNFYRRTYDDALLQSRVGELRKTLRLDGPTPRASLADAAWFALACGAGLVVGLEMMVLIIPVAIFGNVLAAMKRKR